MRRRLITILVLALGLLLFTAQASLAQSPHFKKNGGGSVRSPHRGELVHDLFGLAGRAGQRRPRDRSDRERVRGLPVPEPGRQHRPGQNRVLVGPVTEPTVIPGDQIKNGNVSFTTDAAVLTAPATVTGAEAGVSEPQLDWGQPHPHDHRHLHDDLPGWGVAVHLHRVQP